jgi:hypothetical protein
MLLEVAHTAAVAKVRRVRTLVYVWAAQRVAMSHPISLTIVALAVLLAACSGVPQRVKDQTALQQYLEYSGAPLDHFTYLGRYDDWRALSSTQLVVWTSLNEAYLLTVRTPCINLQFTQRVGLTSTAGTVSSGLDSVLVDRDRCQITEIRPVDYKKMRSDLRKNKS